MSVVRLRAGIGWEKRSRGALRGKCVVVVGGAARWRRETSWAFCVPGRANSTCKGPEVKLAWNVAGKMGQMRGSPRPLSEVAAKLSFWEVE